MDVVAWLRAFVLRGHEQEHEEVNAHLARADQELGVLDRRLLRLEAEKRWRGRRPRERS